MNNPHQLATHVNRDAQFPIGRQHGLTLLELMISLGLSLLLITVIGAVYLATNQTYRMAQDGARIQEAGRYALDLIGRSLRQAGYADIPFGPTATKTAFVGTPVRGVNSACPSGSPVTDIVTVQYDGIVGEQDCQAENIVAGDIVQHTFFIQDAALRCDAIRNATAPTPPTACPANDSGTQVLENVEDLQILYGIDTTGDQSADSYTATPGTWAQVVTARVCVLVRSENVGIATSVQTYFNCAGALGTAADAARFTTATDTRLRRAFLATFTLRNRITGIP